MFNDLSLQLTGHPKTKEWLVSAARSNYQELAKLAAEYPELVRLQVSFHIYICSTPIDRLIDSRTKSNSVCFKSLTKIDANTKLFDGMNYAYNLPTRQTVGLHLQFVYYIDSLKIPCSILRNKLWKN